MNLIYHFIWITIIISTISILLAKNPIHSVFFLILVFLNVTTLLLLHEKEFLALIFLIIYVGAICVLFLFIIMMLNLRISEIRESLIQYIPISFLILIIFLVQFSYILNINFLILDVFSHYTTYDRILSEMQDDLTMIGIGLYYESFIMFLLSGILLFIAMIASIVLTFEDELNKRKQNIFLQMNRDIHRTIKLN